MDKDKAKDFIDRYLNGKASAEQQAFLEKYYDEFSDQKTGLSEQEILSIISRKQKDWEALQSKIALTEEEDQKAPIARIDDSVARIGLYTVIT